MCLTSFLAAPPVAGWFADRVGTEWVTFFCLLLAIPCWVAVVLPSKLSFFVIAFAFESKFNHRSGMA
jgi:MFS transporter, DHA1 family, solute carrier family 18 (vesicular amine transporter), member 1/2